MGSKRLFTVLQSVQELRRERSVAHVTLRGLRVERDKVSRALPWAARAEAGKVSLVRGPWIIPLLNEVCTFPNGSHDDQVDSISGGVALLSEQPKYMGGLALGSAKGWGF